jgi:hypothetical protein
MPEPDTPDDRPDYEVVDRRKRVSTEPVDATPTADDDALEGSADEPGPSDAEAAAETGQAGLPPEVLDALIPGSVDVVLGNALSHLARIGWEALGLVPSPRTGEIKEDLGECQRAIDALDTLAPLARSRMGADALRALDTLLSDLKINYVRKSQGKEG